VELVKGGQWVPVLSDGWIRVRRPDRDIRPVPPVGAVTVCLHGENASNPQMYFDNKGELLGLTEEEVSELYRASDFANPGGSTAVELRRRLLAPIQSV
jgi:hypothetical protein